MQIDSRLSRALVRVCSVICGVILAGWLVSFAIWCYGLISWKMSLLWCIQWSGSAHSIIVDGSGLTVFGEGRVQQFIGPGFSVIGHEPDFDFLPMLDGESRHAADASVFWSFALRVPCLFLFCLCSIPIAFDRLSRYEREALNARNSNTNSPRSFYSFAIEMTIIWTLLVMLVSDAALPAYSGIWALGFVCFSIILAWRAASCCRYIPTLICVLTLYCLPVTLKFIFDPDRVVPWRIATSPNPLGASLNTLAIGVIVATGTHVLFRIRHEKRRRRLADGPICLRCGYNLTGNISGICSECGVAIEN